MAILPERMVPDIHPARKPGVLASASNAGDVTNISVSINDDQSGGSSLIVRLGF